MITLASYKLNGSSRPQFARDISELRFHLTNIDPQGVLSVNSLRRNTPNGKVMVRRVNGIDYIYMWPIGGFFYIALISDLDRGFKIKVTHKNGTYEFAETEKLKKGPPFSRYMFEADYAGLLGQSPRRQYIPYIFKWKHNSHASVGDTGSPGGATLDPKFDWNYKYYILDCTGDQDANETIWRPPTQLTRHAFGTDLIPMWYSMSPNTSHGWHHCYETGIDQFKRLSYPVNTVVTLVSDGIEIPEFTLLERNGNTYNWGYPTNLMTFYGKNTVVMEIDETTQELKVARFAGKIKLGGVIPITKPDVDEICFFWPWIPYLDEIRCFNILWYAAKSTFGQFEGWVMTPTLDSMRYWEYKHRDGSGVESGGTALSDAATFSNAPISTDSTDDITETECDCYDCGTGTRTITSKSDVGPYTSSGTRNVPIGLVGQSIINMRTDWTQSGNGPHRTMEQTCVVAGNFPYVTYFMGGTMWALEDFCLSKNCGHATFQNTSQRIKTESETATNAMALSQTLSIGTDVIFTGTSSMTYTMQRTLADSAEGTIVGQATLDCPTEILYTTNLMTLGSSQYLHFDTSGLNCWDVTWTSNIGSLQGDIHSSSVLYTAPDSNPNCAYDTVKVICGDTTISLVIAFNSYTAFQAAYLAVTTEYEGGYCCRGVFTGELPNPSYECGEYEEAAFGPYIRWSSFTCTGQLFNTDVYSCGSSAGCYIRGLSIDEICYGPPSCGGIPLTEYRNGNLRVYSPCGSLFPNRIFDVRTDEMKAAGCCPAPIALTQAFWDQILSR